VAARSEGSGGKEGEEEEGDVIELHDGVVSEEICVLGNCYEADRGLDCLSGVKEREGR